jgi:hypothetical protein
VNPAFALDQVNSLVRRQRWVSGIRSGYTSRHRAVGIRSGSPLPRDLGNGPMQVDNRLEGPLVAITQAAIKQLPVALGDVRQSISIRSGPGTPVVGAT